jgi:hypothetical protein
MKSATVWSYAPVADDRAHVLQLSIMEKNLVQPATKPEYLQSLTQKKD